MSRPESRVHALALATRDEVVRYYAEQVLDLPERRQVTAGAPAWDCEMLAVWSRGTGPHSGDVSRTDATPLPSIQLGTRWLDLSITITRCSTTIEEVNRVVLWPTTEEEEAVAEAVHRDEVAVVNAIKAGADAGRLPNLADWTMGAWKIIGPNGGFVASEHEFRLATDWQPPAPPEV